MIFQATKVSEKVYWVGAIDWGVRDFHGYRTGRGTTYNAYLILADRITLMDTVKAPFRDEMLARISSLVDPSKIDFIVSNHSEMDHTGCLPDVIGIVKPDRVIASVNGRKTLGEHFRRDLGIEAVKDGETLSLGNMKLVFIETKMVHWPDSMFSYLPEEELLFSQDGFGMHLASSERFADEIPDWLLRLEAQRYFANILTPLSGVIQKTLEKVTALGVPIKVIAPDHGPIWREDVGRVIGWYSEWCAQKPTGKAVIVYDSMWGATDKMAQVIAEGIAEAGGHPVLMPLGPNHRSDIATEALGAGALLVGSPTINGGIFPSVADVLSYLGGLKPKNLVGAAFGSYGWSGEAVGQVENLLKEMKVEVVGESVKAKYTPDEDALVNCRKLGQAIGNRLAEIAART